MEQVRPGPTPRGGRVAVVGGSVIGLACAWTLARAGYEVHLYEPDDSGPAGAPTTGAGWVAGGMLAPFSEAWPGEEDVFALAVASLRAWPDFLTDLDPHRADGTPPVRTAAETHLLAVDEADLRDLTLATTWARSRPETRPEDVRAITRRELREAEPTVGRAVRGVVRMPGEGSVDNRLLLAALARACRAQGVHRIRERVRRLDDIDAERVVLAAGPGSAELGVTAELPGGLPIRPVKGEVLRLRARPGCQPAPRSVIRAFVHGRPVYLVPRADGLVVGATQYEHGDDRQVTVGGVRDLLSDAEVVFPGIGEYELAECIAGLRPMSTDNLPYLGPLPGDARTVAATGHGRNGIALTPVTAAAVLALITGDELPPAVAAADPARLLAAPPATEPARSDRPVTPRRDEQ